MRRLLRILLNAATVLSLVLCAVTVAAWVLSYQAREQIRWSLENPRRMLQIFTYRGGLFAQVTTPVGTSNTWNLVGAEWQHFSPMSYDEGRSLPSRFLNRFGFGLDDTRSSLRSTGRLACPYWFILLLTAILPVARLAGWRRRWARRLRRRPGLCRHCGYDCRATPECCPECGRVPADAAEKKSWPANGRQ